MILRDPVDVRDDIARLAGDLPSRPIAGIRDLQYIYGRLYTVGTAGQSEYSESLTPDEASQLVGQEQSLVIVYVDLSGERPRLDTKQPVEVRTYTAELIGKVAHSYYDAGRGADHSITHRTGARQDAEDIAKRAVKRLSRWPKKAKPLIEDHPDSEIIDYLLSLGDSDEVKQTIRDAVSEELDGNTQALVTVRVKLDRDGAYIWPGDEDVTAVFAQAMARRRRKKMRSKNEASDAAGEAVDLVTGEETTVVGTSEDPLYFQLSKHTDQFPEFEPDESWRQHPLSEDTAIAVENATTFLDACSIPLYGGSLYYLPYMAGELSADDLQYLYELLYETLEEGDTTPIEQAYRRSKSETGVSDQEQRLRFHVVTTINQEQKRLDVAGETPNARYYSPVSVADAHREVLSSWAFRRTGPSTAPFQTSVDLPENFTTPLLDPDTDLVPQIVTGNYAKATMGLKPGDPEVVDEPDNITLATNDTRIDLLLAILTGRQIPVELLIEEYTSALLDAGGSSFPTIQATEQFAQLTALAKAGLLTAESEALRGYTAIPGYLTDTTTTQRTRSPTMSEDDPDTEQGNSPTTKSESGSKESSKLSPGERAELREQKLQQFLDDSPMLDHEERQATFLLGVLVGQVAGYQQSQGKGQTLVDKYPIRAINGAKLKRITQQVLDKNLVYSQEQGMAGTMYSDVVERLVPSLAQTAANTDEWEISTDDIRFAYALGVSYGMNDYIPTEAEASKSEDGTQPDESASTNTDN